MSLVACPSCGFQNPPDDRFCTSCGAPLTVPYPSMTYRQPYYGLPPQPGLSTAAKVVIIVVVVLGVLVFAPLATFLVNGPASFSTVNSHSITITSLSLVIVYPDPNAQNGYFGNSNQDLCCPKSVQPGGTTTIQVAVYLHANETSHTIDKLSLTNSGGFNILTISPPLPITAAPGTSTAMTVALQAPNADYHGPVIIDLYTH